TWTVGPFSVRSLSINGRRAWRVLAAGRPFATVETNKPQGDAERLAAAMNQCEGIPTVMLRDEKIVEAFWLTVSQLVDVIDPGEKPVGGPRRRRHQAGRQGQESSSGDRRPPGEAHVRASLGGAHRLPVQGQPRRGRPGGRPLVGPRLSSRK